MDLRISDLPVLLPADLEENDLVAVADLSASETRKLTVKGLIQEGFDRVINDGTIPGSKIEPDSITSLELAPDSVTDVELADNAVDTDAIQDGAVTADKLSGTFDGGKLAENSVTSRELAPNSVTDVELADNAVDTGAIQDGAVTNDKVASGIDGAKLSDGTVTNVKLADGIDGGKLVANSVTSTEIAPNAVGASELADNAVDTAALQNGAVTNDKVAAGTLTGDRLVADTLTSREIGPDAITASELADNAVDTAAVQNAAITNEKLTSGIDGAKLLDDSVTNAKLAAGIDGGKLAAGSVTSRELAANSVTAVELADNSVDTNAIVDGSVTNAKLAGPIDGSLIEGGTLPPSAIGAVTDRGLDQSTGNIGHTNSIASGTRNGISFDAQGHITGTSALVNTDLPPATTTQLGAVIVPTTSGLTVDATGALDHENSITPGSSYGVSFDEHGHITGVNVVDPSELPIATQTTVGVVSVPGPELEVDTAGAITHKDSTVIPSTYTKVAVNQKGHVTTGSLLVADDIPNLDASKIVSGEFGTPFIANKSITYPKLADYSIAFIQEAQPPLTNNHIGALWYQESTAALHMWNGNSWMPISIGRLSQENLRYCGIINASTGLITGVTEFGIRAGYNIGDPLQPASDPLTGTYFVVEVPGSNIPETPGITYDAGDWVLCNGAAAGYVRIDTLSGGGGSGGAQLLDDLLDVTLTSPADGQMFVYTSAGQWVNTDDVVGGTY